MQMHSGNNKETNWIPVSFTPKNEYAIFIGKDENGYIFVRVEDVEQKICRLLLPLGGNDQLRFFHEIEHTETDMGELIEVQMNQLILSLLLTVDSIEYFFYHSIMNSK